jgi:hypothetical protein
VDQFASPAVLAPATSFSTTPAAEAAGSLVGLERTVPEQVAALQALALIGGPESAQAVARLITLGIVQGPTRKLAVRIAARLASPLPAKTVLALLQNADPAVRADACRCAEAWPAAISVLLDLTEDNDADVRVAALCALGRLSRREAPRARPPAARGAVFGDHRRHPPDRRRGMRHRPGQDRPDPAGACGRCSRRLETIKHPRARQVLAAPAPERDRPAAGR